MDGWMGHWALKRFPSPLFLSICGGSVSYTSRVMHLYCGIVVVIIINHQHKLSLPVRRGTGTACGKEGEDDINCPFRHLIVVGYIYDRQGWKGDVFSASQGA